MVIDRLRNSSRRLRIFAAVLIFFLIAGIVVARSYVRDKDTGGIKNTTVEVQGDKASTPEVFTVSPAEEELSYSSPTFQAAYEFNAIAPNWKESDTSEDNREVSIRTSKDGKNWSEWAHVEAMRPQKDDAPYADRVFPEAPIITLGKFFQYKVELSQEGDKSPRIEDMNVTYIDSRPSATRKLSTFIDELFTSKARASNLSPNVISRSGWGSPDPDGNAFKGQDLYWAPVYSPTKQAFVHHTVSSDYSSHSDGASVVRAVWEYQAKTLGWGDIGYNYLVDQTGKVYEGRAHGDNVVGGHTYEYNKGSMAVALLGCFQPSDSMCQDLNSNTPKAPSGAMLNSLTSVLAWSMARFEIDSSAQQVFCKSDGVSGCLWLHTISGHRDATLTSCPGDLAYQELQTIRNSTVTKKTEGFYNSAKQINYPTVVLGNNNESSVTLRFKNTGTNIWYSSGNYPVNLVTANNTDHASVFRGSGWLSDNRPARLTETSVPPGAVGSFTFNIANPNGFIGDWHEYFGLVVENSAHFGNYVGVPIITRNFSYTYSSQQGYTDSTKVTPVDLANLSPGQNAWLVLKIVNTSSVTWSNTGSNPVNLATDEPRDRNSRFCTSGWLTCNRPAKLTESSVAPNSIGTFEFPIQIPAGGGIFPEYFTPIVEGLTWMQSIGIHYSLTVNSNYSWNFVGQSAYTDSSKTTPVDTNNLSPGQTFFFSVIASNAGNTTWYNSGPHAIRLGTSRPNDRVSAFYDSSWITSNRVNNMAEQAVAPRQTGRFEGTFTTPASGGEHKEYLQPVAEGITWLNDVGLYLPATVKANYSWSFVGQQAYTDATMTTPVNTGNLAPGQRFYFVVTARNTGTATWYNNGRFPLRLGTSNPRDRISQFHDNSWLTLNRITALTEASVPPGSNGRFGGYYEAPNQAGAYKEYLLPVAEGVTWLNDLGLYIPAEVK